MSDTQTSDEHDIIIHSEPELEPEEEERLAVDGDYMPSNFEQFRSDLDDAVQDYLPHVLAVSPGFVNETARINGWMLVFDVVDEQGSSSVVRTTSDGLSGAHLLGLAQSVLQK